MLAKIINSKIIRFALVGLLSTIFDMCLLKIGLLFDLPLYLAVALGFAGGVTNGYFLNSRWTFRFNTNGHEPLKFSQFFLVSIVGLGLTELIVAGYVKYFGNLDAVLSSAMTGKIIAVMLVFFWNYYANKHWTFKEGVSKPADGN